MDGTASAQLADRVNEIRGHLDKAKADGWSLNEADTERVVIFPLLTTLGYGPLDIRQRGHDSVANNFPDYTLLPGAPQKWFLEVKKLDLPLQDGEAAQAVNYANNQGAEWAVLTNGRKWYIYNAHLPKPLTEKRVFQIDDLFANESALKTLAYLSRSSMLDGGLSAAWAFEQVQAIVKAQLETPHSAVRKQLRKIAADETKAPVSDALIERALRPLSPVQTAVAGNGTGPTVTPPRPLPKPPHDSPTALYTLAEIAADSSLGTGRRPSGLHFADGTSAAVTTWADVSVLVLSRVGNQFGLPPLPFTNRAKGKGYFINTQPTHSTGQRMKSHRTAQVAGETVYMDTNRSTQELINSLLMLFRAGGAPTDFVKVSIK